MAVGGSAWPTLRGAEEPRGPSEKMSGCGKLQRPRSRLYRSRFLQENIRWKALDELYKIYMHLHRSDLNISENVRQFFSHFWQKIAKIRYF